MIFRSLSPHSHTHTFMHICTYTFIIFLHRWGIWGAEMTIVCTPPAFTHCLDDDRAVVLVFKALSSCTTGKKTSGHCLKVTDKNRSGNIIDTVDHDRPLLWFFLCSASCVPLIFLSELFLAYVHGNFWIVGIGNEEWLLSFWKLFYVCVYVCGMPVCACLWVYVQKYV